MRITRRIPPVACGAPSPAGRRRAFTIVELLVVVSIIMLLIALLLPAMGRSRLHARASVCMSTQRQLNAAYRLYLDDNAERSFVYPGNVGQASFDNFWMSLLEAYTGLEDKARICPEAQILSDLVFGDAHHAWSGHNHPSGYWIHYGDDFHYGSYGLNGWLYRGWGASWIEPNAGAGMSLANVPVFADSSWVDGWPTTTDAAPTNLESPYAAYAAGGPQPSQLGRYAVDRHDKAVNVSLLDGSTERVNLRDLWNLKWSRSFTPGAFDPGL